MGALRTRVLAGCLLAVVAGSASMAVHARVHEVAACSRQPRALAPHAGVYVQAPLAQAVYETRRWDLGIAALWDQPLAATVSPDDPLRDPLAAAGAYTATEIRISRQGMVRLSWRWHESATLGSDVPHGCLVFSADGSVRWQAYKPSVQEVATGQRHYVRVGRAEAVAQPMDAPYFAMLFQGCHTDLHGVHWCFRANEILRDRRPVKAHLKLDPSELPEGGSVLEVQGESQFWLMVPHGGDGWLIYRTGWASEGAVPVPGKTVPWNVLTPDRTISLITKD